MKSSIPTVKDILRIDRFLIPYRIYEGKGPHIICVNGVQQSMAMWQTFLARFSRDYRIVLFDFPNQGKSQIIHGDSQASLDEQVQILLSVMDKTHTNSDVTVCAASWGGVVAAAFAAKYPQRIKRLILASLGTKPNKRMVETIKKGYGLNMNDRERMAKTLIEGLGEALPDQIKQGVISQFRTMKEKQIKVFLEHGLFVIASKPLGDIVNLKNIKVKTILINGEKDTIIDLDDVKFLASQIPNCELKIIKDAGHFLHMEREEVLDIYEDILSS